MIYTKQIKIEAASSIVQIIISGIVLFFLYRFILEVIGIERLGVWSLVLAAGSLVQAANLGLTGSIVKQVADYYALKDNNNISLTVQTAAISIAVFAFLLTVVVFPISEYYFNIVLDDVFYKEALEILPIALIAFWITMVAGIYQGALYGCELIVHRNAILIADSVLHLILCIILAPIYGLIGLAYARMIQNVITLILSILVLRKHVKEMPLIPIRWNRVLFKKIIAYAANFQIISLLVMISDPITKGYLSKYGSVTMVGYYEMANKMVVLFRSLLINANQVLVPMFARYSQIDPTKISKIFLESYQLVMYLSVPGFFLLAVSAPLISVIWLGHYESYFIWSTIVLSGGWLINVLSGPAYFSGVGSGSMRLNVISHLIMTLLNIVFIFLLGQLWGGFGVVVAWALALIVSGATLNFIYYRENSIPFTQLIPKSSRFLITICSGGLIAILGLWWLHESGLLYKILTISPSLSLGVVAGSFMVICYSLIVSVPLWRHPLRVKLLDLILPGRVNGK